MSALVLERIEAVIPTFAELVDAPYEPRVHGNGFLQLDLNAEGTRRLHIWDSSLPRQKVPTPIHDHVFAMRSTVIRGVLEHEELEAVVSGVELATHRVYRAHQEPGTQNTILVPDPTRVRLNVVQRLILQAGSLYTFPALALHTSEALGLTATIMEKVNPPILYGRPRVLCELGQEPDNDFHRDGHDQSALWALIEATLWHVRQSWEL